jgi:uncharacterized Zn finger protein (UPF0148 family)
MSTSKHCPYCGITFVIYDDSENCPVCFEKLTNIHKPTKRYYKWVIDGIKGHYESKYYLDEEGRTTKDCKILDKNKLYKRIEDKYVDIEV